ILPNGSPDDPAREEYLVWKVSAWHGSPDDSASVSLPSPTPGTDNLVHHSWSQYMNGAVPFGAPWKLHRLPDTSTPDPSDSVDVPGPDVLGDQMLWCIYNDADPARHNNNAGSTAPLGVEVRQTVFGFNSGGPLASTVFLRYEITNRGTSPLDTVYAAIWTDPDLGGANDDLVGIDVPRSLGFVYNATNNDQLYGGAPPALGIDLLQGSPNAFDKYINGTDPNSPTQVLNYMRGRDAQGFPIVDPVVALQTSFMHPGDPVAGTGWLDSNPADRRMLLTRVPFHLEIGQTVVLWAAVVIGQSTDRLSSIQVMRQNDDAVQQFFDEGFSNPPPPPPDDPCLQPGMNCPRAVEYWRLEVQPGPYQLLDSQMAQIAVRVNQSAGIFDWPAGGEFASFAALMTPPNPDV